MNFRFCEVKNEKSSQCRSKPKCSFVIQLQTQTSRDRPKSVPYLRLKNSKRTSKCQSILYSTRIFLKSLTMPKKTERGEGPFGIFQHPFCRKTPKKIEKGTLWGKIVFPKKSLAMAKKTERAEPLVSSGIVCYVGNLFG